MESIKPAPEAPCARMRTVHRPWRHRPAPRRRRWPAPVPPRRFPLPTAEAGADGGDLLGWMASLPPKPIAAAWRASSSASDASSMRVVTRRPARDRRQGGSENQLEPRGQQQLPQVRAAEIGAEVHRSEGEPRHAGCAASVRACARPRALSKRGDDGNAGAKRRRQCIERSGIFRLRQHDRRRFQRRDGGDIRPMHGVPLRIDADQRGHGRGVGRQRRAGLVLGIKGDGILQIEDDRIRPAAAALAKRSGRWPGTKGGRRWPRSPPRLRRHGDRAIGAGCPEPHAGFRLVRVHEEVLVVEQRGKTTEREDAGRLARVARWQSAAAGSPAAGRAR